MGSGAEGAAVISFFANGNGSGEIRGRQMADHLGARLNPTDGYAHDVCVYVKRHPPDDHPPRSYVDIIDAHERVSWLHRHPDVGVIASSVSGHRYLERVLGRPVVLIPQHHCNFDRDRHAASWSLPPRLGVVGGEASMPKKFAARIAATRFTARTRMDVVKAYQQIDVQVIWRGINRPLKNALKIINAASFGIPTVALPEVGYEEMEGYYWPVKTEEELRAAVEELSRGWDEQRLIGKAESYHIDHIAKWYRGEL